MSQTNKWKDRNEKQYFPTETVFRGGCFPICQCFPPSPNEKEHIFSIIITKEYMYLLLYNFVDFFTFSYSKYQSSILYNILCKTLDISRILRTFIYFKTVNINIKSMTSCYKIP